MKTATKGYHPQTFSRKLLIFSYLVDFGHEEAELGIGQRLREVLAEVVEQQVLEAGPHLSVDADDQVRALLHFLAVSELDVHAGRRGRQFQIAVENIHNYTIMYMYMNLDVHVQDSINLPVYFTKEVQTLSQFFFCC